MYDAGRREGGEVVRVSEANERKVAGRRGSQDSGACAQALGVSLRPVTTGDEAFLLRVFASTRETERHAVDWSDESWDDFIRTQSEAQRRHYTTNFSPSEHMIVLCEEQPIGRIWVYRDANEIRLLDIAILAPYRGKGIGTCLIRRFQKEAQTANLPLRHSVELQNHGARRLYERIGFVPISAQGLHILMEWVPRPSEGEPSLGTPRDGRDPTT